MVRGKALGKGLEALFPDSGNGEPQRNPRKLPLSHLVPNPEQPRRFMDPDALQSLADSIREHGIVQPLLVRELPSGEYQIVAGERRWRAARMVGLEDVPVHVLSVEDGELLEVALVENIQREDLSPLDVAEALSLLIEKFGLTQEEVATRVGWSRSAVTNKLRLLHLPEEVRALLKDGGLSEGHARVLLSFPRETMLSFAKKIVAQGLSVREVERAAQRCGMSRKRRSPTDETLFSDVTQRFADRFGMKIQISGRGSRMRLKMEGLDKGQITALLEFLEERGSQLFPGK
ncbi:ParB/RepB/Spo0J family partition protein [Aminiphilus circumscriptus]|jgi:ParB family chromosome partitioning protein|uniref:ParB/RepB/Spo0J family partition protein n=1 Tax=Aminiphilus circumscriptus TaxID=290732 RepID=UPI0004785C2A|nr:ParB/RepB/Spo0J family partition protein [Aminiphilus circumscriptus]